MQKRKQLTKSEFQVMDVLWKQTGQSGFVSEILKDFPEPKPAYTTLATFLKILKEKGFVKSVPVGKMLYYTAVVSRADYTSCYMSDVKNTFFGGSFASLVSFFAENEKLTDDEADRLIKLIKEHKH